MISLNGLLRELTRDKMKSKILNVDVKEQFIQELKDGEMETIIIRLRLVR